MLGLVCRSCRLLLAAPSGCRPPFSTALLHKFCCFLFQLDNLTLMEINTIGTFLTQALDHMYKLRTNLQPSGSMESQDF